MPEAGEDTNTPRVVRVTAPISITLHRPGKARQAPPSVITGRLVAEVYRGDTLHHYRVAGDDGVLYCAPPDWLVRPHAATPYPLSAAQETALDAFLSVAEGLPQDLFMDWMEGGLRMVKGCKPGGRIWHAMQAEGRS